MNIESFAEFSARQGDDPIWVPSLGRRVWSNGATSEDVPGGHHEFFEPPANDHARLKLQVARQAVVLERLREVFYDVRQTIYSGGNESAIPLVEKAKAEHDDAYRELERLQAELRNTPEEQERRRLAALERARLRAYMDERSRVQASVQAIKLCTELERQPQAEDS